MIPMLGDSQISVDKYSEDLLNTHFFSKDRLIAKAILKSDGADSAAAIFIDHELIKRHGAIVIFPDGREVFTWDGKPVIEFYPIQMSFDDKTLKLKVDQKYRVF